MNEGTSRRLIDQLGDGYFRSALDGRLLWVNPAGAKMLHYSGPEEMIDRINVRDLYEDAARRDVFLAELQANGEVSGDPVASPSKHSVSDVARAGYFISSGTSDHIVRKRSSDASMRSRRNPPP